MLLDYGVLVCVITNSWSIRLDLVSWAQNERRHLLSLASWKRRGRLVLSCLEVSSERLHTCRSCLSKAWAKPRGALLTALSPTCLAGTVCLTLACHMHGCCPDLWTTTLTQSCQALHMSSTALPMIVSEKGPDRQLCLTAGRDVIPAEPAARPTSSSG